MKIYDLVYFSPKKEDLPLIKRLGYQGLLQIGEQIQIYQVKQARDIQKLSQSPKTLKVVLLQNHELASDVIKRKPDFISFELSYGKDHTHYRKTGFSIVYAKEMSQNKIALLINLSFIQSLPEQKQSLYFGRLKQNIKVAQKKKTPIVIFTLAVNIYEMRNSSDLTSLLISLGANQGYIKKGFKFLEKKLEDLKKIREGKLFGEVEIID